MLSYAANSNDLGVITHNLSLMQEGTVSCVRTTFSDQWEPTLQPSMFANPVIVRKEAPETGASFVIR